MRQDLEARRSDRQNLRLVDLWILDMNADTSGTKIMIHPPWVSTMARKLTSIGRVLMMRKYYDTGPGPSLC